jgi:hypothetical protein
MIRIKWSELEHTCTACESSSKGAFSLAIGALAFSLCRACAMQYDVSMRRASRELPVVATRRKKDG